MTISKYKNKLVIFVLLVLLSSQETLASSRPPAPRGSGGFQDGGVVGSPGPIDDFVPIALAMALLYGVWLKYKQYNPHNLS